MSPALRTLIALCLASPLGAAGGCIFAPPNKANNALRKQRFELRGRIEELERQHQADQQLIQALQSERPTVPTLPPERLGKLFTTHGLKIERLTGGVDLDRKKPGDEGIKVYVVPTDASGQDLKAAGSFIIEAFDLNEPQSPLVGRWTFDVDEAKKRWQGAMMRYEYGFTLPWDTWQRMPKHGELTVKVTFVEALTGLPFGNQAQVKVNLPPETAAAQAVQAATQPTTQPQ